MTKVYLVALFFFQGEWVMLEGFYPIATPSVEMCEIRKESAESYLSSQKLPEHHLVCITTTPEEGGQAVQDYIAKNLAEAL